MNWRLSRGPAPRERHFARETAQSAAVRRIIDATGRQQERKGRRREGVDRLGNERQPVVVSVGEDGVLHGEYAALTVL